MSKTLVIVRHGKSTWDYTSILDIDRPLIENGINKTIQVATKLKERKIVPDKMMSSHANRALHTAMIMARELGYPFDKVVINPVLYHDSDEEILDVVRATEDSVSTLIIFGHNPSFTILSNVFLKEEIENQPTSGAVVLEFDTDSWKSISRSMVKKEMCVFPKKQS